MTVRQTVVKALAALRAAQEAGAQGLWVGTNLRCAPAAFHVLQDKLIQQHAHVFLVLLATVEASSSGVSCPYSLMHHGLTCHTT